MKEEEIQIINGLKAGNESAYNQLFNTFYTVLSAFANKYIDDPEVTRDIVQDLFVYLFENRQTFVITTSLKSYLFQAVQNRCLNHLNSDKLHENHHQNIKHATENFAELEELIMETELEHLIFQNVDELPDQCRRIFLMSRVEGKRNKEIAEELNISIRTVETQISKALKVLRQNLKDYLNP